MFVSDILAQKGTDVFSANAETSVAQLVREMSELRVGSMLVRGPGNGIAGIVSERDLVHALARHGAAAIHLKAKDVMTSEVTTCDPGDTIDHVMEIMTHGRFRHLPVIHDGELLGLISIGDVVKLRLEETRHETEALKAYIVAG